MKIDVFTAFSGYDSQCLALRRLADEFPGFSYDLVGWSEIDRYAILAHNALFPQFSGRNFGDISKIDWRTVPDFDLFTYSFPCQSISSAGRQHGLAEGSGTRSSLLWECRRAIAAKKPRFLLMENVPALLQSKFLPDFQKWQLLLSRLGYSSFTAVLNAADFSVPQNRERVFMVSVLDSGSAYYFPRKIPLARRLRDVLEPSVPDSYYLSDESVSKILSYCQRKKADGCGFYPNFQPPGGISGTILTMCGSRTTDTFISEPVGCASRGRGEDNAQQLELSGRNVANCLTTVTTDSMVAEPMASVSPLSRKLEFKGEASISPVAPSLRASDCKCPHVVYSGLRIRRLTPRECLRLMDVPDADIDKIQSAGISRTQQYKLAGNSIVVSVLFHIFRTLFIDTVPPVSTQLQIF